MLKLIPIPAFVTNYIWCLSNAVCSNKVVMVDVGAAAPVLDYLKSNKLELAAIFITHHHNDHTAGLAEVLAHYPCPVYAHSSPEHILIPELNLSFRTLSIPGHTLDHTAFYGHELVFSGDTLFAGGCGRLFEGTYQQLYASLQTLATLPPETQVYCGHEYTEQNLKFGLTVEPNNQNIASKFNLVKFLRAEQQCTLPSSIMEELNTNVFLRCNQPAIKTAAENYAGEQLDTSVEIFRVLREWKNDFS